MSLTRKILLKRNLIQSLTHIYSCRLCFTKFHPQESLRGNFLASPLLSPQLSWLLRKEMGQTSIWESTFPLTIYRDATSIGIKYRSLHDRVLLRIRSPLLESAKHWIRINRLVARDSVFRGWRLKSSPSLCRLCALWKRTSRQEIWHETK